MRPVFPGTPHLSHAILLPPLSPILASTTYGAHRLSRQKADPKLRSLFVANGMTMDEGDDHPSAINRLQPPAIRHTQDAPSPLEVALHPFHSASSSIHHHVGMFLLNAGIIGSRVFTSISGCVGDCVPRLCAAAQQLGSALLAPLSCKEASCAKTHSGCPFHPRDALLVSLGLQLNRR